MPDIPYLDNHATTRVDPRVVEAMLPYFGEEYGNAGSLNHAFGRRAKQAVEDARARIANAIGAEPRELVFTSGATESNNLALRGVCDRLRERDRHLVSVTTEHKSVLDPLRRLARRAIEVTWLHPPGVGRAPCGVLDPAQVFEALRETTSLVSIMLANNEIGALQPLSEIGAICRQRGVLLHTDATAALGKIPVDVTKLNVDLMSISAHKLHGPKGIGALFVRRDVRLQPQIDGGGQEHGIRGGTLNVPLIVGFARALELCLEELPQETNRLRALRDRLARGMRQAMDGVTINGPALAETGWRLPGNLNLSIAGVDGAALLTRLTEIAVSSGSACSSSNPEPSHVLKALGVSEELARASLRFGLGRFNHDQDVDLAIQHVAQVVAGLRQLARC